MKKKHHFVPKFYLRRFATLEPEEKIWTYDMERGSVRSSTVENTGFEKYLYSTKLSDGSRLDDLEDFIANVEGKAAPLFDKFIIDGNLVGQERADFASFTAMMFVRTDTFRRQFAKVSVNLTQTRLRTTAAHDRTFASFVARYESARGALSEETKKMMRDGMMNPSEFIISVDKGWSLRALRFHDKLAPLIYDMQWTVLDAKKPSYLITSDNPVVKAVPDQHFHSLQGEGFINKHVEITMPLSSNRCLLAHWKKGAPKRFQLGRREVRDANRIRAVHAGRFLFCKKYDSGIENLAKKYQNTRSTVQFGLDADEFSEVELRRT